MTRTRDGMLEAKLGNGMAFLSSQQFIVDEPDPTTGRLGRIDAYSMVKAADGYVLASELGGDLVPEGWADDMERETTRDPDAVAADFGRAATALNALAYTGKLTQGVTLGNEIELGAMHRLAQTMVTHLLPVRDGGERQPLLGGPDNQIAAGGRYQTYIQVWRKKFVGIAEHSGTRVGHWLYNSTTSSVKRHGGWTSFCNHGTCAAVSPMTHKCTYTGPRLTYYRRPSYVADGQGTCTTKYNLLSMMGGHNCHDDSSVQVRAVRGQSYSTSGGRCGVDGLTYGYAPTCDAQ